MADDPYARIAELEAEVAALRADAGRRDRTLAEVLEHQAGTSEILRVIAASSANLSGVLEAVAQSAMRLSFSVSANVVIRDGDKGRTVATAGDSPHAVGATADLSQRRPGAVAIREGRTIHIPDLSAPSYRAEFPDAVFAPAKADLTTPLLRGHEVIGSLNVSRDRAQPYSERQIELIETFADQAVIAIENARLFSELQDSNRQLSMALEQQTALGEVLRMIASSPTDLDRVLHAVVETSRRLCDADAATVHERDGDGLRRRAESWGRLDRPTAPFSGAPSRPIHGTAVGHALTSAEIVCISDIERVADRFPESLVAAHHFGWRANLIVPLLRGATPIGIVSMYFREPHSFADDEIDLVKTFADQVVIAIENTRLFEELQDRVRELQALGDVGQAVNSSLNLAEVLTTIVANATRLAGADSGIIYEYDEVEGVFAVRAADRMTADLAEALHAARLHLGEGAVGRAAAARAPIQVEEVEGSDVVTPEVGERLLAHGLRSILAVPLLREDRVLGGLVDVAANARRLPFRGCRAASDVRHAVGPGHRQRTPLPCRGRGTRHKQSRSSWPTCPTSCGRP